MKEIQSYEKLQNTWKSFSNIKPKLLDDIAQLDNLQKQSISTQTQLDLLTGKQTASHIQQSKLKQELAHASAQVKAYADKTEQHAHGWRHALFRKRFEAYQASLTQSLEQAAQLEKQLDQINAERNLDAIWQLGTSHTILSTDCGDPANPPWEEAMRQYLQFMLDHGVSSGEIRAMTRTLPAWLLGLEDVPKQ